MSKVKDRGKGRISEGKWTKVHLNMLKCPAWKALSTAAQALYPHIALEWNGPQANNNGDISISVRQAADRLGVSRNTAAKAFHDLQAKGFIVMTSAGALGVEGHAKCPTFELTDHPPKGGHSVPKKLYRSWTPENDFEVIRHNANNPHGRNGKTPS